MAAQQSSVVLPVRRGLRAGPQGGAARLLPAPAFHLFLRGGKLLLDAKISNLSLARGEFVSLIPFTAKPAVFPAAKRSKFAASSSTWRGEDDVYAKIGRVPVDDRATARARAGVHHAASCALYIFPTKALLGMTKAAGVGIYDGDTPMRDHATRVLITNPDMLHVSILP